MLREEEIENEETQILEPQISKDDLRIYLVNLPRDLTIYVNDKEYHFNKLLISSQSGFFAKKINENQVQGDPQILKIEINDSNNTFPLIASFLNGVQIDITPENVYSLHELAVYFEISSLLKKIKPALDEPNTITNIIYRIIHAFPNVPDDKFQFLLDNINQMNEEDLFQLPPPLLAKIIKRDDAKFESPEVRFEFALKCYLTFSEIDNFSQIISQTPLDYFSRILDSNFFERAHLSVASIARIHKLNIELQKQYDECDIRIKFFKSMIQEQEKYANSKEAEIVKLQNKLSAYKNEFDGNIKSFIDHFEELKKTFSKINQNEISETKITNLKKIVNKLSNCQNELEKAILNMESTWFNSVAEKVKELNKKFKNMLDELKGLVDKLSPNSTQNMEINEILIDLDREISNLKNLL